MADHASHDMNAANAHYRGPGTRLLEYICATLMALLDYLMANEHDLLANAEAIGVKPEALALAARKLGSDW